ncbi:hypothetical protein NDU88_002247 [Pleurodeles waltl]|uniref:Uncharacterized protein n=1 Tax=Pleurodeles waltl TaxID=8319 RepID=A0AAV7MS78_PLEWA|nr:hypothetical protein NDU88_002247 [Pleurodeles waltl]
MCATRLRTATRTFTESRERGVDSTTHLEADALVSDQARSDMCSYTGAGARSSVALPLARWALRAGCSAMAGPLRLSAAAPQSSKGCGARHQRRVQGRSPCFPASG